MIKYWQQEDGKLVEKEEDELNRHSKIWVDARSVTRDDIAELEEKYKIDPENMLDALDPDELSRIDYALCEYAWFVTAHPTDMNTHLQS